MDVETIRGYCIDKQGVTEDFPFDESSLAFRVEGKIFAMIDLVDTQWLCLKCNPAYAIELRESYDAIQGAWHWNKKYWNQLDHERLPQSLVCQLIDHSYEEVLRSLPRKIRNEYGLNDK